METKQTKETKVSSNSTTAFTGLLVYLLLLFAGVLYLSAYITCFADFLLLALGYLAITGIWVSVKDIYHIFKFYLKNKDNQ